MIYLKSGDYREANCLLKDYTQQFPNHRLSAAMFLCSRLLLDSEFSKQLMIQKDRDELPCSMKYLIELTENAPILQSCNNGKKLTIDAFIFFLYGRYQNLSTLNSDLCVREILTDLTDIFEFLDLALLETINHSQLKYIESLLISIFARLQTLCTSSEEGISLNHLLKRFCTAFSFSKLTFLSSNNTEPKCLEDSLPYMLKSSSVSLENDSPSAAIKDLCRAFFRFPHQTSIIENLQSSLIQHRPDKASRITPVYPKKSTFPNVDRFVASIPNYFRTLYLKGKFSSCKKWISRLCFLKPNELDNFSLLQRTADVIRLRDNTTLENQGFSNSNPNELVYVDHRIVMKNARLALTNQAVDSVVGSIDILQGVASSLATINFSKTAILCLSKLVEYCEKHSIDRAIPILHHLTFLLYFQRQLKTGSKYFSSFSHYNSTALRSFFRGIFFRLSKKANSAKSHFIDAIVESEDVILKSLSMVNYGILLKAADFDLSKRLISSALVEIERLYPENELWKKFRGNFGLEILES